MGTKNTRELLLKSAINLFAQKGYANTSIREIGAKTGISSSIIYHYFENKEEILFEIIQTASQDLVQALLKIEGKLSDPVECLQEMIKQYTVDFCIRRMKEAKIILTESYQLRGKRSDNTRKIQREIYNIYKEKSKEIEEKGLLNDIDLRVLTFSIFGIIYSFFSWYKEGSGLSKEEVAHNIMELVFHGILKKK